MAKVAIEKGIPTLIEFFGTEMAKRIVAEQKKQADLVLGNNVLAQVPGLNDFVRGIKVLLKPQGVVTIEFPHLVRLMDENQFDTIYHEHFSSLSPYLGEDLHCPRSDHLRRRGDPHSRRITENLRTARG